MIEILKDLYGRIPDELKGILGVIADIVSVLVAVWGVVQLVYTKYLTTTSEIIIDTVWKDLVIVVLSVLIVFMLMRRIKSRNKFRADEYTLSSEYHEFLSNYRDLIKDLESAYNTDQFNQTYLTNTIECFLEKAMNCMSAIFTNMSGHAVCSCIKVIVGSNGYNNISYNDACVKTFVRSKNTDSERKEMDIKIKDVVKISNRDLKFQICP